MAIIIVINVIIPKKTIKACIISIDAFKGRESKCIIALNWCHNSIPRENHIGKLEELTDYSKLNVWTTRSTKYLFMGINRQSPSSYFTNNNKHLESSYIKSWELDYLIKPDNYKDFLKLYQECSHKPKKYKRITIKNKWYMIINGLSKLKYNRKIIIKNYPIKDKIKLLNFILDNTFYHQLIKKLNYLDCCSNCHKPYLQLSNENCDYCQINKYTTIHKKPVSITTQSLNTPSKNKLLVNDIVDEVDLELDYHLDKISYGINTNLSNEYDKRLMGHMGELILVRELVINSKVFKDNDFRLEILHHFLKHRYKIGIDEYELYSRIIDNKVNQYVIKNKLLYKQQLETLITNIKNSYLRNRNDYCLDFRIINSTDNRKIFYMEEYEEIVSDVELFVNYQIPSIDLESKVFFNIAILLDHLLEPLFRPMTINYINIFRENITPLIHNVQEFIKIERINKPILEKMDSHRYIEKDIPLLEEMGFNQQINKDIFETGYECLYKGKSDLIENNTIIEIKTSNLEDCQKNWIQQVVLYYLLQNQDITIIKIVNILQGSIFTIKLNTIPILTDILEIILDKFKYIPALKYNFIESITKHLITNNDIDSNYTDSNTDDD